MIRTNFLYIYTQAVFDHVEMRYRPGLPLVLKGLSVRIPAASKCGVVGRTGDDRLWFNNQYIGTTLSAG